MEINKIYQIDAYEGMQQLDGNSVDLVLTDPPYGTNIQNSLSNKMSGHQAKTSSYENLNWDKEKISERYFEGIFRVSHNQILFGYNHYAHILGNAKCIIVWDKQTRSNLSDCELAWTSFTSGVKKYEWLWDGFWQENMVDKDKRIHPTQKPIGLFKAILSDYSEKGDLVLDPFIGSGTTGIAARALDRNFIGFENNEKYVEIARKRLRNVQKELIR